METREGLLLTPPDRGQILGRAVWKPRYVVIGSRNPHRDVVTSPTFPRNTITNRHGAPPKMQAIIPAHDGYFISIFKSKIRLDVTDVSSPSLSHPNLQGDWEPLHQFPLSSVVDCQVQTLAHRKQSPFLPTLIITINDKEKKRRSSRAAGLISKEPTATTLWLRTPPEDHHISLHDWAHFILARKLPMSPESPLSPAFSNPFIHQRPWDFDYLPQSPNGTLNFRGVLQHKNSVQTYSSRDCPGAYSSDSPSLRSKRSDVSSPTSVTHPAHAILNMPDPNKYSPMLPSDIPSPVATMSDCQRSDVIDSWVSMHGSSSIVSSPIRGRSSVGSGGPQSFPAADSYSPPTPRETILDRAFQLRCIPGCEYETPGEEKLTSLARFDALMREAEEKMRHREGEAHTEKVAMSSGFDVGEGSPEEIEKEDDEDDEDEDNDEDQEEVEKEGRGRRQEDDEHEEYAHEAGMNDNGQNVIPPHA